VGELIISLESFEETVETFEEPCSSLQFIYMFSKVRFNNTNIFISATVTPHSSVSKTASVLSMSKAKHPVIAIDKPIAYQFGEWRYVVVP
jgi:hypothetical protein